MPLWGIPLVTTLASTAYDLWQSNQQGKRADQLQRNNVRPEFKIPESQKRALTSAENQAALTEIPGAAAIRGRLDRTTADQVAMVERMGPGGPTSINAASRAYGQQMDRENDLGVESARMRLANQGILRDELHDNAEWEQKAWDWNTGQPYLQKQQAIAALREAQLKNRNTGFKNLLGGLGNTALMGMLGDDGKMGGGDGWFESMTGGGARPHTTTNIPATPGYGTPYNIDEYQRNTSNTSGYPLIGDQELVQNNDPNNVSGYPIVKDPEIKSYMDKMYNSWTWGL